MESNQIRAFLNNLGKRHPYSGTLFLLGGSALCLLGSPRPTLDIDYFGDDLKKDEFQQVMEDTGREMGLDVEAVPIDRRNPSQARSFQRQGLGGFLEGFSRILVDKSSR
jgi:hypothetical protein